VEKAENMGIMGTKSLISSVDSLENWDLFTLNGFLNKGNLFYNFV